MMRPTQKKDSGNDDPCILKFEYLFSFPAVVRSCTRRKRDLQEAGVPYLGRAMQMLMLCLSPMCTEYSVVVQLYAGRQIFQRMLVSRHMGFTYSEVMN